MTMVNMMSLPSKPERLPTEKVSKEMYQSPEKNPALKETDTRPEDFSKTLERVSHEKESQKEKTTTAIGSPHLNDIQSQIQALIENPEAQTVENVNAILHNLLSLLQNGVAAMDHTQTTQAKGMLHSLKDLMAQWEQGQMNTQAFLTHLMDWLNDGAKAKVFPSFQQDVAKDSMPAPQQEKPIATPKDATLVKDSGEKKADQGVFRVVDKRTEAPSTIEKEPKSTESFTKSVDSLIKHLEVKENISHQTAKPPQDFGAKITTAPFSTVPRISVEQMLQQVAGKALVTLRDGQSEMRLQLTPPDLGRMDMKIVLEDGQMMGKIVVSTPEAKALFDQNLGELARQLQQVGVQVGQLDVSLGQPGNREDANPSQEKGWVWSGDNHGLSAPDTVLSSSLWDNATVNYVV